jgi:hypothetical protein
LLFDIRPYGVILCSFARECCLFGLILGRCAVVFHFVA